MALDYTPIQSRIKGMSEADIIKLLEQEYGNQNIGPIQYNAGDGLNGINPSLTIGGQQADPGEWLTSTQLPWDTGTYARNLTGYLDPGYEGGRYGRYVGNYDKTGALQNVEFQQGQRDDGFLGENMEWIAPAIIAAGTAGMFGGDSLLSGITGASNVAASTPADIFGAEAGIANATTWTPEAAAAAGFPSVDAAVKSGAKLLTDGTAIDTAGKIIKTALPIVAGAAAAINAANQPDTLTSSRDIPEELQPYRKDILDRGQKIADTEYEPIPTSNKNIDDAVSSVRRTMDQFGEATSGARNILAEIQGGYRDYTPGKVERASNAYIGQTTPQASNPYIGATTPGISGPSSVMGLAQSAQLNNPYIDRKSGQATTTMAKQAGKNALLGMGNPYLTGAIDAAMADVNRNYQYGTEAQRNAQKVASGAFGNTGVQEMELQDRRNLQQTLANTATNMRMQDYGLQAELGEGQAGREQGVNLANAGFGNQVGMFNVGINAGDLERQTSAWGDQGRFNAGNLLEAGMFDVGQQQNTKQFNADLAQTDLGRNATLAGQQEEFNSTLFANDLSRNADLSQDLSKFNSGVSTQDIDNQFGAWQANNNLAMDTIDPTLAIANAPMVQAGVLHGMGSDQLANDYREEFRRQQWPTTTFDPYLRSFSTATGTASTTTTPNSTPDPWAAGIGTAVGMYNLLNPPANRYRVP